MPGYDITATFRVGAIPKGVAWGDLAPHLRSWFHQQAGAFPEGDSIHKVPGLGFELEVLVEKTPDELLGPSGSFLVMRRLPADSLLDVARIALGRKLPKLAGTPADRRVLLLEKADIVHGYAQLRNAVDSLASDFPELGNVDEIWVVTTYAWDSEAVVWFYELFPDLGGRRFQVNTKNGIVVSMR